MAVRLDRRGAIAVLRFDRPEVRNALDHATLASLADHSHAVGADPTVRAVVLTGARQRAFGAGLGGPRFSAPH